jgi:hypothetical protein
LLLRWCGHRLLPRAIEVHIRGQFQCYVCSVGILEVVAAFFSNVIPGLANFFRSKRTGGKDLMEQHGAQAVLRTARQARPVLISEVAGDVEF